ncbi:MAG: polysaccharide deacetylase family protein [Verrucomicrobiales bacterium]
MLKPVLHTVILLGTGWFALGAASCSLAKKSASTANRSREAKHGAAAQTAARSVPKQLVGGPRASYSSCQVPGPYLAMTFDDGPHPTNTPRLLEMLRQRNVKASFFLIGNSVDAYPNIARMILADGHEIANHTKTHASLSKLSDASVEREITSCTNSIVSATGGYRPQVFRPPYGAITTRQKEWLLIQFGLPSIMWSVDPLDWQRPGVSVVAQRLISRAHPGAIMLAHDIHAPTIEAMPQVLDTLLQRGYHFVTVSQLINLERAGSQTLAMNFGAGNL